MIEVDFRTVEIETVVAGLLSDGCVLLRHCVDTERLADAHRLTRRAYDHVGGKHVHPAHLAALDMPTYEEMIFDEKHKQLVRAIFGTHEARVSKETAARRVVNMSPGEDKLPEFKDWCPPLGPHLDAFVHASNFTINFWTPFRACGLDAPSLSVVSSPYHDVIDFTGYRGGVEVWRDPEQRAQFSRFRPQMLRMHRGRDPLLRQELETRFRRQIHSPVYAPGDIMLLSNWTLHFSHATPQMTAKRENLELRFSSPASLDDVLRDHGRAPVGADAPSGSDNM